MPISQPQYHSYLLNTHENILLDTRQVEYFIWWWKQKFLILNSQHIKMEGLVL